MVISTELTRRLAIEHPILLGAMDIVADARLVIAVTEAGGLGLLGGGYGEEGWLRRELGLLEAVRQARGTRFGVGFITWSLARQPHLLTIALAARPDAIWLSFGDPGPFIGPAKAAGIPVICQVQSVAMAVDAVDKGADIVVAQGAEAGGHGVARGTFALVPAVVDAVGGQAIVVAAGGVADGRGLAAALMLGAQGVVLGTRLYASEEAAGHPAAKRRIVEARGDETVRGVVFDILRRNLWPGPYTGRCLANEVTRQWMGRELELLRRGGEEADGYAAARASGNFDIAAVIAGEAVDLIADIRPAGAIVRQIAAEAEALLAGGGSRTFGRPRAQAAE